MPFGLPDTALTTELDAINYVMKAKGLDLVTSIDLGDAEVADAAFHLNVADLGFQSKGWYFNKDYCLSLALDSNSHIPLPAGTLGVAQPSGWPSWPNFTERAGKLYNLTSHTYIWAAPVVVDIVVRVAYTDMPDVARRYVAMLGAHNAQGLDRGLPVASQITQQMLMRSLAEVEWKQDETTPANQVHGNLSVQAAINGWGGIARATTT